MFVCPACKKASISLIIQKDEYLTVERHGCGIRSVVMELDKVNANGDLYPAHVVRKAVKEYYERHHS